MKKQIILTGLLGISLTAYADETAIVVKRQHVQKISEL